MKYNRIIGIDVGLSGGIAQYNWSSNYMVDPLPMPIVSGDKKHIDPFHIADILRKRIDSEVSIVVIEKATAMPKQGVSSTFKFGEQFGMLQGICVGLGLPYIIVRPQEWKKLILKGYDTKDKASSVRYVQQKYPHINLLPTDRCRKPSDGMADAVCIAEYGLRVHAESGGNSNE